MNIQYGPIERWPGTLKIHRRHAPFKSSYTKTIDLLERELGMIRADSIVIQLAIPTNEWRLDGRPRVDAKPKHPGIIVSFMKEITTATGKRRVPLSFPCDTFNTYEANLRAVALSLEALRKVDRYGVTQNAEQYLGFKQLPPPGPSHDDVQTVEEAAQFVARAVAPDYPARVIIESPDNYRSAYRKAAATLHPDMTGGQQSPAWAKLQAAASLLDAHHHV